MILLGEPAPSVNNARRNAASQRCSSGYPGMTVIPIRAGSQFGSAERFDLGAPRWPGRERCGGCAVIVNGGNGKQRSTGSDQAADVGGGLAAGRAGWLCRRCRSRWCRSHGRRRIRRQRPARPTTTARWPAPESSRALPGELAADEVGGASRGLAPARAHPRRTGGRTSRSGRLRQAMPMPGEASSSSSRARWAASVASSSG